MTGDANRIPSLACSLETRFGINIAVLRIRVVACQCFSCNQLRNNFCKCTMFGRNLGNSTFDAVKHNKILSVATRPVIDGLVFDRSKP